MKGTLIIKHFLNDQSDADPTWSGNGRNPPSKGHVTLDAERFDSKSCRLSGGAMEPPSATKLNSSQPKDHVCFGWGHITSQNRIASRKLGELEVSKFNSQPLAISTWCGLGSSSIRAVTVSSSSKGLGIFMVLARCCHLDLEAHPKTIPQKNKPPWLAWII